MKIDLEKLLAENKKLLLILLLAAFFILPGISQVDLLGDNGHYFIRAVGYVDHVFSAMQTTPIDWYPQFPKWAFLSFHDHPFLLFFIQHIFISLHESLFFAKLPYVLLSLGAIMILYLWIKQEYGEKMAVISAILLAINPLFIWTARAGFMEAGVIFFVALSFYYFFKFCQDDKYWLWLGLSLGLAFLSKYNSFFLIPTFLFYLLFFGRDKFRNKKTYYAAGLALLVFLPSIIYNTMLYKTRGHFDYQFSRLLHVSSPWQVGNVGANLANPWHLFLNLGQTITYIYLFLVFAGIILAIKNHKLFLPVFGMVFATLMFVITGGGNQYFNLYNIMLAPLAAYLFIFLKEKFSTIFKILFYSVIVYLLFVTVNSNVLIRPILGIEGVLISSAQSKNYGFYQLGQYMDKLIKDEKIENRADGYSHIKSKYPDWLKKYGVSNDIKMKKMENTSKLIVFDQDINWFGRLWPLTRIQFYDNIPMVSVMEMLNALSNITDVRTLYYIQATDKTLLDSVKDYSETGQEFKKRIMEQGGVELEPVYRSDGEIAFRIYKLQAK